MRLSVAYLLAILAFTVMIGACTPASSLSGKAAPIGEESRKGVEDIYVVRSVRESRRFSTILIGRRKSGFCFPEQPDRMTFISDLGSAILASTSATRVSTVGCLAIADSACVTGRKSCSVKTTCGSTSFFNQWLPHLSRCDVRVDPLERRRRDCR